jgi:hypothetical protein
MYEVAIHHLDWIDVDEEVLQIRSISLNDRDDRPHGGRQLSVFLPSAYLGIP